MCLKWANLFRKPLFVNAALVKLSLYALWDANHSGNFTPGLPSASSTSGCRPPQRGHHGNRREASAGVILSMFIHRSQLSGGTSSLTYDILHKDG